MLPLASALDQIITDLQNQKTVFLECDSYQDTPCWSYHGTRIDNISELVEKVKSSVSRINLIISESNLYNETSQTAGKVLKQAAKSTRVAQIKPADSVTDYTPETLKEIADYLIQDIYSRSLISRTVYAIQTDAMSGDAPITLYPHTEEAIQAYTQAVPAIVDTVRNSVAKKLQSPVKISELRETITTNHRKIFAYTI